MKHNKDILGVLILIGITIGCIFLSIVITKAIINADIPLWLKFWLLK